MTSCYDFYQAQRVSLLENNHFHQDRPPCSSRISLKIIIAKRVFLLENRPFSSRSPPSCSSRISLKTVHAERVSLLENSHFHEHRPHGAHSFLTPPRSILCIAKIQSPPNHILCVPKTQSPPTKILCVDKIRSPPPAPERAYMLNPFSKSTQCIDLLQGTASA